MISSLLQLLTVFHTKEELRNKLEDADYYMTGSDQVFGPVLYGGYDWSYFLDFVPDSRKKIAYAASFGKMEIDNEDAGKMQLLLNRYNHVAVREKQAVELLDEWNIDAVQVIDPTLLFNAQEWKKLINYSDNKNGTVVDNKDIILSNLFGISSVNAFSDLPFQSTLPLL